MSNATSAPQKGIDYQARWFWWRAAQLLWPDTPVAKVWFESGPRGLDDVGFLRTRPIADRGAGVDAWNATRSSSRCDWTARSR